MQRPLNDRNNMFLAAGYEVGGTLQWSQPELVLYDNRRDHGHGYPDIITDHNGTFITETYKVGCLLAHYDSSL